MKRVLSAVLAIVFLLTVCSPVLIARAAGFADVAASYWAYDEITALTAKKVINGYPDGTFKPEGKVTREEFAKMIVVAKGLAQYKPSMATFTDVATNRWSYGYVEAAAKAGYIVGIGGGKFAPAAQIKREDMAVLLVRVLGKEVEASTIKEPVTAAKDASSIDTYAIGAVTIAARSSVKVLILDASGKINPVLSATRGDCAFAIYNTIVPPFGDVVVNEWNIPFLNSLTGAIAAIGEYLEWGAEYAAKEINAQGGIAGKPVKVVGMDTALDPQLGSVVMARIVKDTLVALGPVPEPVIMAAMPIAVENGMVSMCASTSLEYAQPYFPWTPSWFPNTNDRLPPLIKAWAKQFSDLKQVVQFVEPYGPWPNMAKSQSLAFKDLGITELPTIDVPSDAVTFGSLVVKALGEKPDGIVLVCNADKAAKIIKELKSRGWTKMDHILVFSSADGPALYSTGGADLNGVQIYNFVNLDISNPRWDAFKIAFAKAHNGELPFSLSPNYYDAVYMIKEAIENTGVTGNPKLLKEERKKIADYMANVKNFKGVLFTWDMKDDIPTNKPTYIFKIQDGKKILVATVVP